MFTKENYTRRQNTWQSQTNHHKKLTKYYRNAIINNLGNEEAMTKSIFATIDHCRSTDLLPRHDKCPSGKTAGVFTKETLQMGLYPGNMPNLSEHH